MIRLIRQTIAVVGLLLFTGPISGCGVIGGIVANSIVHNQESAQDRSICKEICSERTGDAYSVCYNDCVSLQEKKRKDQIREREQEESFRNLRPR